MFWMNEFSQATDRAVADKQLRDLIFQRRIAHDGNNELREHVENAAATTSGKDEKQLRIVKQNRKKKIDLTVALSMAAYECLRLNL